MRVSLEIVYKNGRYRLVKMNNKYYLIDCDSSVLFYFFPFLVYFWKHRWYSIKIEDYQKLTIPKDIQEKNKEDIKNIQSVGIGIVLLTPLITKKIIPMLKIESSFWFYTLLIGALLLILGIRIFNMKQNNISKKYSQCSSKVLIRPYFIEKTFWQKNIIFIVLIVFLIISIIDLFEKESKDYLLLLVTAIFLLTYVFYSRVFLGKGEYKIKIIEECN